MERWREKGGEEEEGKMARMGSKNEGMEIKEKILWH